MLYKTEICFTFAHTKTNITTNMYQTNLKRQIESMEVGDSLRPARGYREITLRNYASQIGKALGRKFSVTNIPSLRIIRTA